MKATAATTRKVTGKSARSRARTGTRARSIGPRLIRGLTEVRDALAGGEALSERFTVRTVQAPAAPSQYPPDAIKHIREEQLRVSQAVFAQLLGVSAALVRAWEAKRPQPPAIARRLLDQIRRDPSPWIEMITPTSEADARAGVGAARLAPSGRDQRIGAA